MALSKHSKTVIILMVFVLGIAIFPLDGFSTFSNRILINNNLGGVGSSTHYRSHLCMGQTIGGESSSASYANYMGFMYFLRSGCVDTEIVDLTIAKVGNNIVLNWSADPCATEYHVYRSDVPDFDISGMTPLANPSSNTFTDSNITATKWFYKVTIEY